MNLDTATYRQARINNAKPALAFDPPQHFRDPQNWQNTLRPEVNRLLGGLDQWQAVPLDAEVGEAQALDGYTRRTVTFTTRPGLRASGYYLVPNNCPPASPAVLCLPGHGRGVDSIVGIAADGTQRALNTPDEYAQDFALQCVAQGYPTFALEQISFGRRRSDGKTGDGSSCVQDSMAALMLGETMAGWRVWDALRAIDFLQTCPEVDPARIAVMGISGGGMTALFAAALDTRIAACVVSGYLNTWAGSILAVSHCVDNFVPGILNVCDMSDIAGLIAPRPFFAESGASDPIFPVDTFRQACARVAFLYMAFGAAGDFQSGVFSGEHVFHGKAALPFLKKVLTSPLRP